MAPGIAIVEVLVYNCLAFGSLFSYFSVMFTDPGGVPLDTSTVLRIERKNGDFRRCVKCEIVKPDRAHHCSICESCTLKMDHHCPWTNNCIGFRNYKYFNLFILYTPMLCIWNLTVSIPNIILLGFHEFSVGEICVFVSCFIAVAFAFTLFAFFGTHLMLVLYNQTTLESYYDHFNPYDMGTKMNFHQVFGSSAFRWFLPVPNYLGSGLSWPAKIPNSVEAKKLTVNNDVESDRSQLLAVGGTTTDKPLAPSTTTASTRGMNFNRRYNDELSSDEERVVDFENSAY
jgi:hypothetical protein